MTVEHIGKRTWLYRQAKGLTLTELALKASTSKSQLWALENVIDGNNPTISLLRRIAEALDVTLSDLTGESECKGENGEKGEKGGKEGKGGNNQSQIEPTQSLSTNLKRLVTAYKNQGNPLDTQTVIWLANAPFKCEEPVSIIDYILLLKVLANYGPEID